MQTGVVSNGVLRRYKCYPPRDPNISPRQYFVPQSHPDNNKVNHEAQQSYQRNTLTHPEAPLSQKSNTINHQKPYYLIMVTLHPEAYQLIRVKSLLSQFSYQLIITQYTTMRHHNLIRVPLLHTNGCYHLIGVKQLTTTMLYHLIHTILLLI
ncbi:hypothetical protein RRG08_010104 [Elysia crispata]|uniref:Uncharacterized protein n=1 Tax=Elysia crispata TaxID=231223 RepID=A0AAE0YZS7_9GAST|nr:hypothetical protein RRG08_010104 [Elysia crispata]